MKRSKKGIYINRTNIRGERSCYDTRTLFDYWYTMFNENYYNGRRIKVTDKTGECDRDQMYTSLIGYSELLTYVCIYLLENSLGEICLTLTRKGRETHLCFFAKTKRTGILNPITTFGEYAEATGDEDKRIANAFQCAYHAYAQLCYSRNVYGDEYFDIAFNCADIGSLGFKADNIDSALRSGMTFALLSLNIERYPSEPEVNPVSQKQKQKEKIPPSDRS